MSEILNELIRLKFERAGATPDVADALAILVRSKIVVQDDGVKILDGDGNVRVGSGPSYGDMTLDEAINEAVSSKRGLFGTTPAPTAAAPSPPPGEMLTARIAREARENSPAPSGEANPWAKGTVNVTQQVLIQARDPSRAARLKTQAEAVPAFIVSRPA